MKNEEREKSVVRKQQSAFSLFLCETTPQSLIDGVRVAASTGYEGVELPSKHLVGLHTAGTESTNDVVRCLRESSIELAGIGVGRTGTGLSLEDIETRCRLGEKMGARVGFFIAPDKASVTWQHFLEESKRWHACASAYGIDLTLHHHAGTLVETPDEIERALSDLGPDIDLCYDSAHWALFSSDLKDGLARIADRVRYAHLKDLRAQGRDAIPDRSTITFGTLADVVPFYADLGTGVLDMAGVLSVLRKCPKLDWIVAEVENLRFPTLRDHAEQNYQQLIALSR